MAEGPDAASEAWQARLDGLETRLERVEHDLVLRLDTLQAALDDLRLRQDTRTLQALEERTEKTLSTVEAMKASMPDANELAAPLAAELETMSDAIATLNEWLPDPKIVAQLGSQL